MTLVDIATAQAERGDLDAARQTFEEARSLSLKGKYTGKVNTLADIATAQAKVGELDAARRTLQEALQVARSFGQPLKQVSAFKNIAAAQAEAGEAEAARETLKKAAQKACVSDESDRKFVLRGIATTQAAQGDFEGALQTAGFIDDKGVARGTVNRIAAAMARAGEYALALETICQEKDSASRFQLFSVVVEEAFDLSRYR